MKLKPPNDAEYMDGDAFLYVNKNDVCVCASMVRPGAIKFFLRRFFELATIRHDATQFEFFNALDSSKMALIERKGVKQIEIKGSMSRAAMEYKRENGRAAQGLAVISRWYKSIFSTEFDVADDAMHMSIVVGVDGRNKKGTPLGYKRLEAIAIDIIDNQGPDDEYIIHTKTGEKIFPHEIVLRSSVQIGSLGKSVNRDEAWAALACYYESLTRTDEVGA